MITAEAIRDKLLAALPGAKVAVIDSTGTFDHFEAQIVAPQFAGLSRLRQHQAVYDALGVEMRGAIHALALKTSAP